jgi:hypothetical protein
VESIHNEFGTFAGVTLYTSKGLIQFYNDGYDSGFVNCDPDDPFMKKWNFTRRSIH